MAGPDAQRRPYRVFTVNQAAKVFGVTAGALKARCGNTVAAWAPEDGHPFTTWLVAAAVIEAEAEEDRGLDPAQFPEATVIVLPPPQGNAATLRTLARRERDGDAELPGAVDPEASALESQRLRDRLADADELRRRLEQELAEERDAHAHTAAALAFVTARRKPST